MTLAAEMSGMLRGKIMFHIEMNTSLHTSVMFRSFMSPQTLSTVTSSPHWGSSTISSPSTGMWSDREAAIHAEIAWFNLPKCSVQRDHILISIIEKNTAWYLFYIWNWAYTYIYSVWKIFSNHNLFTYLSLFFYDECGNGNMKIYEM